MRHNLLTIVCSPKLEHEAIQTPRRLRAPHRTTDFACRYIQRQTLTIMRRRIFRRSGFKRAQTVVRYAPFAVQAAALRRSLTAACVFSVFEDVAAWEVSLPKFVQSGKNPHRL